MALYYNLPIYKASYRLVFMIFGDSSSFAREYKYTVGQELKKEGTLLIKNIYRANKAMDKAEAIGEARENVEMIILLTRLMQNFNQLSLRQFVKINQCVDEVSKQLTAWEKYNKKRLSSPESPVARAQASARSKSNNPLAKSKERCPASKNSGHIARLHQKNRAINSEVIFPLAGNRNRDNGSLNNQGSNGNYWSSSPNGANARNLNFNASSVNPANNNNRANGFSVRCVKDLQKK